MAINKRKCPNGHQYDASIYGDNCPFCPNPTQVSTGIGSQIGGGKTQVSLTGGTSAPTGGIQGTTGTSTSAATEKKTEAFGRNSAPLGGGHTTIRKIGDDKEEASGRRIVGLLVSFSVNPCGEIYKLYEGRNTIGRDVTNDIAITSDPSVSQLHLVIAYRAANNRFVMEDQLTSNGTWVNGEFTTDRIDLKTNDVIVIGGTKFVFLAIPEGL